MYMDRKTVLNLMLTKATAELEAKSKELDALTIAGGQAEKSLEVIFEGNAIDAALYMIELELSVIE